MKYIDSEKLIAEIERFSATEYGDTFADDVANSALNYVLEEIIPSLQQEQSEVDLEKEIDNYLAPIMAWQIQEEPFTSMENIARHFYELGLNAGK